MSNSSKTKIANNYWHIVKNDNWCFSTQDGVKLFRHKDIPIERHIKVKGNSSPYDGDWVYWCIRMGKYPETTSRMAKLLKSQNFDAPTVDCSLKMMT